MMDGAHPNELDLLAYVEEDLPAARKLAVAEHVAACPACADSVQQLETARNVLRTSPLLELPADTRAAVMADLPARAPRRRLRWRPGVIAPALATAAVAAVIAGAVVTAGGGEDEQEAAQVGVEEPSPAEQAAPEADEGAATGGADDRTALSSLLRSVEGPPGEVARLLRRRGFDARVVDSTVVVRNAQPAAVLRALAPRRDGPVPVEVIQ
jgi:hypothetical protein